MARLNKIAISLCALLFTLYLIHATGSGIRAHAASASPKALPAKGGSERKKKATSQKTKTTAKTTSKKSSAHPAPYPHYRSKPNRTSSVKAAGAAKKMRCCVKGYKSSARKTVAASAEPTLALNSVKSKCVVRKGYKNAVSPRPAKRNLTIADAHRSGAKKRKVPR